MKKNFLRILLISAFAIALIPNQVSAMKMLLNHQGKLTDATGTPVADGNYTITYSLWDDPTIGNMLWTETISVSVTDGLYSVVLGDVQAFDPSIFSDQLYLEIQIGADSPLAPRSILSSTPYAAMALSVPGFTPGPNNIVTGQYAFAAGDNNSVLSDYGSITGGQMNQVELINNTAPSLDTTGIFDGALLKDGFGFANSPPCLSIAGWIGAGASNTAFGASAAVGAGGDNHADGFFSAIIGGCSNNALGSYDVIAGGISNMEVVGGGFRTIGGGRNNVINSLWYSSIVGGIFNTIDAPTVGGFIGGGFANRMNGHVGAIGGGYFNSTLDFGGTVGGGQQNNAVGRHATISGGMLNTTNLNYSTVGGGYGNSAAAEMSTIAGGGRADLADPLSSNEVYDNYGTIGGGGRNKAGSNDGIEINDQYTTISGGYFNQTLTSHSTIGGGNLNTAAGRYATVGGGSDNYSANWASTIGGGQSNEALGYVSTVSGGLFNLLIADSAVIGGGTRNTNGGEGSVIAGGNLNNITNSGRLSVVGGGTGNLMQAAEATIAGGARNTISTIGTGGTIGGGSGNIAGNLATVPGGIDNFATGDNSFAAGSNAKAVHSCSFVWADCCVDAAGVASKPLYSTGANTFNARATGGFFFLTNCDTVWDATAPPSGAYLPSGGSMWLNGSDKNLKRNIREVNNSDLLEKVASLPIYQWSYKTQDESIEHIGPMAQDFYKTFNVGDNNTSIGALDPAGISLAAIKQLHSENLTMKSEIEKLKQQIDENKNLSKQVSKLTNLVEMLLAGNSQATSKNLAISE